MGVSTKVGMAVLRLVIGLLFVGHGMQKLAGWFGGGGIEGTGAGFEGMGLKPGRQNAIAAGASEAAGGALLAAGLATPLGAAMISGAMASGFTTSTSRTARGRPGAAGSTTSSSWRRSSRWRRPGPGPTPLDHALGVRMAGPGVAVAELAVGVLGAAGVATRAKSLTSS